MRKFSNTEAENVAFKKGVVNQILFWFTGG